MGSIQYPLARDEMGVLHWAETAPRHRAYTCPACHAPMILRRGAVRIAHFAHAPAATCSPQRMLRMVAAMAVCNALTAWRAGTGLRPHIERRCAICGQWVSYPLSARSATCRTIGDSVVMISDAMGKDLAAIVATTSTSPSDPPLPPGLAIPWGTVDASAIIRNPTRWVIEEDALHPIRCTICRTGPTSQSRSPASDNASAADPPLALPARYYRYAITACPACKRAVLVFGWPGMRDGKEPTVQSRPRTIRHLPSRIIADAQEWVTICPHCHMTLDSCFTAAPVRGGRLWIPVSLETSEDAWHDDMRIIACEWTSRRASTDGTTTNPYHEKQHPHDITH